MLNDLARIRNRKTGRFSSWDKTGRNGDNWHIEAGETAVLADIKGPAQITHIWMTQGYQYRECLLKITYDNAKFPSVLVPLGDFFGLGNCIMTSYESALFTASKDRNDCFYGGCALNCYAPMPFRERCVVELVNESKRMHFQYFYVDYETLEEFEPDTGYFHAEFRRTNPFGGWAPEMMANVPLVNIANKGRLAWDNNYVILDTKGRGHYIGCNLSVANFQGLWWGEGDDMIWVDGYKWPPDLHGTGSEDYFNQAWGMQDNAFMRNGSSVFEGNTIPAMGLNKGTPISIGQGKGGYQTSYVYHLENPVRFQKEIKVTIEVGHGNHLANDVSSVAYWYAEKPTRIVDVPPVEKRMPVLADNHGNWIFDKKNQCPGKKIKLNTEMKRMKAMHRKEQAKKAKKKKK